MHKLLAAHGVPLASNQIELSLLRQSPLKNGLVDKMHELGVVGLAYSPLAQGRLSGKYSCVRRSYLSAASLVGADPAARPLASAANPPPSGRKFSNIPMAEIDPLVAVLREIAYARGVSVSAVALNWVLAKGLIPLGGAKNAEQAAQVRRPFLPSLPPR